MPILECRCGMITSIPENKDRGSCTRCGCASPTHLWRFERPPQLGDLQDPGSLVRVPLRQQLNGQSPTTADTPFHDDVNTRARSAVALLGLGTTDDRPSSKLTVSRARQILDWLEQLSTDGQISQDDYEREVRQVLRIVVREVSRSLPR